LYLFFLNDEKRNDFDFEDINSFAVCRGVTFPENFHEMDSVDVDNLLLIQIRNQVISDVRLMLCLFLAVNEGYYSEYNIAFSPDNRGGHSLFDMYDYELYSRESDYSNNDTNSIAVYYNPCLEDVLDQDILEQIIQKVEEYNRYIPEGCRVDTIVLGQDCSDFHSLFLVIQVDIVHCMIGLEAIIETLNHELSHAIDDGLRNEEDYSFQIPSVSSNNYLESVRRTDVWEIFYRRFQWLDIYFCYSSFEFFDDSNFRDDGLINGDIMGHPHDNYREFAASSIRLFKEQPEEFLRIIDQIPYLDDEYISGFSQLRSEMITIWVFIRDIVFNGAIFVEDDPFADITWEDVRDTLLEG
ncbi:hypothetical protein ACFL56_03790, partial [Candidatus Margulisiibacteriota bacterium]